MTGDGEVLGGSEAVNGALESGIWEIPSTLEVAENYQWLTLSIVAHKGSIRIRLATATYSVGNLASGLNTNADGGCDFPIGNFESFQFLITCSVDRTVASTLDAPFAPPSINLLARRSEQLGDALIRQFENNGDTRHLDRAIWHLQNGLSAINPGDPERPGILFSLGIAHLRRFQRGGDLPDIEEAISRQREAVELVGEGDLNIQGLLSNLGNALEARFDRLGSLVDIEDAISSKQKAVELTPDGHPDKPAQLNNLGNALQTRFQRLGRLADIEDAISSMQKAVELTSDGHPGKPGRLSNLGNALEARFYRLGSLVDIEDAISSKRKAVELTPDGHPDKPGRLNNLGNALEARFDRLGSLVDIEDAISSKQKAVELTPDGHPDKPAQLNNLGNALQTRFQRLGCLADIEDAISSMQKAVELTSDGHPGKPGRLSNLGNALEARFDRLGSLVDIEDAISSKRKAVELTPDGHPDKPAHLNNLGNALQTRFQRLGRLADIEDAISSMQKAVELTPDGHPDKPGRLNNLGNAYRSRFKAFNSIENLEAALGSYSTAAKSIIGPAMIRFTAARAWATTASENSRSPLAAFSLAIDLLPQVAWFGLAVSDQHALLADIGEIVRSAVAAAIKWEAYETAVEWAEQGRSVVWQNMLGLRTPLDKLRETHSSLANKLQNIAQKMETPTSDDSTNAAQTGLRLAAEWDHTIEEIRQLPGFEMFLKPKTSGQLAPAAHEGPVVILNAHESRCDALILVADESNDKQVSVFNIPLTRFSYEKCQKLSEKLAKLLAMAGVRARGDTRKMELVHPGGDGESEFRTILRLLWVDVVKPIVEGLAYQVDLEKPPRIWWCATGPLAFLPIHAAGIYGTETGETLSEYVVSSYTPTLTAILDTSAPMVPHDFKILTIAQPSTPYATPIPETKAEIEQVEAIAGIDMTVSITSEHATVDRVLQEMRVTDWIHLACHGQQCTGEPMKSGLLLHDRILELSEIVKLALPRADFAFLSACQTATGDEKVADESVHLAAGMFMAGYRGVIATMWSIKDNDAPRIARDVYQRILKDGRPNRKEAAHALHDAVKTLRESGASFMSWVPFIHVGR